MVTTQLEPSRSQAKRGETGLPRWPKESFGADLGASLVVFLVALPLCVGVAVASGVPVELGVITGVVGGIVVGLLPGSSMQVSGPAAGLTVVVASAVGQHGLGALGVIVLGAGLLQILMGVSKLGTWFRAISPSVVQGMLAGIGLVLILGQIYPVGGLDQPVKTADKFAGLPGLVTSMFTTPAGLSGLAIALLTLGTMTGWQRMPQRVRMVPGALIAVLVGSAVTYFGGLPLGKIEVGSLLESINVPTGDAWSGLASPAVLGSIVTFALIASAESLFSAAAADRMHDGPKTQYNKELLAQGVGNTVCGFCGALPMTAVIVRSATNVRAGARTKLSRVLHGIWLLLFVMMLPSVLNFIPTAVLAAVLIQAGWKLLELRQVVALVREHRPEATLLVLTAIMIVATDLLVGTLVGLAAAILKTAIEMSRLTVNAEHHDDHTRVELGGNATFLRLPRLLDHLERLPMTNSVHLDLTPVRHPGRATRQWSSGPPSGGGGTAPSRSRCRGSPADPEGRRPAPGPRTRLVGEPGSVGVGAAHGIHVAAVRAAIRGRTAATSRIAVNPKISQTPPHWERWPCPWKPNTGSVGSDFPSYNGFDWECHVVCFDWRRRPWRCARRV